MRPNFKIRREQPSSPNLPRDGLLEASLLPPPPTPTKDGGGNESLPLLRLPVGRELPCSQNLPTTTALHRNLLFVPSPSSKAENHRQKGRATYPGLIPLFLRAGDVGVRRRHPEMSTATTALCFALLSSPKVLYLCIKTLFKRFNIDYLDLVA